MSIEEFIPSCLKYRGEGNNSIVLADLKTGNIFRFRKSTLATKTTEHKKTKTSPKELELTLSFRQNVICRLLGEDFTPLMKLLDVSRETLETIDNRILKERPAYRTCKRIDLSHTQILISPDATLLPQRLSQYAEGPVISIEIKPKWGFIPQSFSVPVPEVKKQVCRYCMLQFHKSKTKLWSSRSEYCPCDLFSGVPTRMMRSLYALVDTPQVNLRVFKNGALILNHEKNLLETELSELFTSRRSSHSECVEDFLNLVQNILVLDRSSNGNSSPVRCDFDVSYDCSLHHLINRKDMLCESALHTGSILGRVLSVQMLSPHDILELDKYYDIVTRYLKENHLQWDDIYFDCLSAGDWSKTLKMVQHLDDKELVEAFEAVEKYLIGMVAKDCSLMIALQRAKSDCPVEIPTVTSRHKERFVVNALVIDLDPKPLRKIEEHFVLEREIIDDYLDKDVSPVSTPSDDRIVIS